MAKAGNFEVEMELTPRYEAVVQSLRLVANSYRHLADEYDAKADELELLGVSDGGTAKETS